MSSCGVSSSRLFQEWLTDLSSALLTGEREWEVKQRIESILSKDATFDKSRKFVVLDGPHQPCSELTNANLRPFMTRTQLYNGALAIMNRLHEMKELHRWSQEESNMAFKILDEGLPIALHMAGSYYFYTSTYPHV